MVRICWQSSRSTEAFNSAVIRSICDELEQSSGRRLYGGDIDVITDVIDDVVERVDWVAMDDCLFEASDTADILIKRIFD